MGDLALRPNDYYVVRLTKMGCEYFGGAITPEHRFVAQMKRSVHGTYKWDIPILGLVKPIYVLVFHPSKFRVRRDEVEKLKRIWCAAIPFDENFQKSFIISGKDALVSLYYNETQYVNLWWRTKRRQDFLGVNGFSVKKPLDHVRLALLLEELTNG